MDEAIHWNFVGGARQAAKFASACQSSPTHQHNHTTFERLSCDRMAREAHKAIRVHVKPGQNGLDLCFDFRPAGAGSSDSAYRIVCRLPV